MTAERRGSVRILRAVVPGVIDQEYTDGWSAFDRGTSPQLIKGLGVARCACAVKSFQLAREAGITTHFIEQVGLRTIRVKEFAVPGHPALSRKTHGRVLPVEWIWRTEVRGSLWERIRTKEVDPISLGFGSGETITVGSKLPRLLQECTTKYEKVDRLLSDTEAKILTGLSYQEWGEARKLVEKLVAVTNGYLERLGFRSPDGKKELGLTHEGQIIPVDVFCTPDENRILHKVTGELYSKDLLRHYLQSQPWKAELDAAKAAYPDDKDKWPPYPIIPDYLVELVTARYAELTLKYAGVPIRR